MSATLLAGLTMLVIGESHLTMPGSLIDTLPDELTKQGAHIHAIGACGANAADWLTATPVTCRADRSGKEKLVLQGRDASTVPLQTLVSERKPDVIVIIIGDTMAAYQKASFPRTWAWNNVTSLTKAIAATGTPCVWVGPPWGKEGGKYGKTDSRTQLMSQFLASNVAPCTYVDSLTLSKPGQWQTMDGLHFTVAGYKSWATAIAQTIVNSPSAKTWKKP